MTVPILKRTLQFGPEASKPASCGRSKKKTVTMVIPKGVFGGRGKTEFKKTPSRVTHTGINFKKRGKQSSITIQRKCAWYNAQLEAEKRGINLEDPPKEWQTFFDNIKNQLERPNDGEGLVHKDGRLIWSIPSVPGSCVEDKENRAKENVAEKIRFLNIDSRKQQNTAAEMRLFSNLSPVQSRWVKRRGSGVTRGLVAVLNARLHKDNKQKSSSKPAVAAGPPPIVVNRVPQIPRVRSTQEQHTGTRETTPCLPRAKALKLKGVSTAPRTLFDEKCYASGGKRIKRRRSMSARAQRIMSMSMGGEVTKKPKVRNPLQVLRREFCNKMKTKSPLTSSKPDLVPFRKDDAICEEGNQKTTDVCKGMGIISRNRTRNSQQKPITSPGQLDSEVILRSAERPTPLVLSAGSASRNPKMLEAKTLASAVNVKVLRPENAEAKHDTVTVALHGDIDVKKIPNNSLVEFPEHKSEYSQQPLSTEPSSNKGNENILSEIDANYSLVTTPLQSPVISCISTRCREGPSGGASTENSEKRKKLDELRCSTRKKRMLESDSQNTISSEVLRPTKSSEIALPTSPSDKKSSTLTNSVISLQIPATPDISKPVRKKLSPGFIISKSEKRKNSNNAQMFRSSKRIRFRKLLASKKKEPYTFFMEETLVTPQRLVVQEKEQATISNVLPGGGERLKPVLGIINPHSEVNEAKAKVIISNKQKSPQRKIRTRKTLQQRKGRRNTTTKKKLKKSPSLGSHKSNFAVVHPVTESLESEECAFLLSFDRLKNNFKLLERDVEQMAALHKKRFTAVFSKMEKLETMVEVLGQNTRDALDCRSEYVVGNAES